MAAVWMRVRAEARSGWRAWLALALVLGVSAGAATAAAVGARRTETAYPRFVEQHAPYHVFLGGAGGEGDPEKLNAIAQEIASLPMVERSNRGTLISGVIEVDGARIGLPEIIIGGGPDDAKVADVNTATYVAGRPADLTKPDELIVDFFTAERLGLAVDDEIVILIDDQNSFPPGPPRRRTARIVGVGITPYSLPAVGQVALAGIQVTPAFWRENMPFMPGVLDQPSVRLRRGSDDVPAFIEALGRIERKHGVVIDKPLTLPRHLEGVAKTLRFDVWALWVLSILIGGGALLVVGQAFARQTHLESSSFGVLRAVGMSRVQLFVLGVLRAAVIGLAGAFVCVLTGYLASPLTPRGLVRLVEPDPGLYADAPPLAVGFAATVLAAILVSILPAARAARVRADEGPKRASIVATALASAGATPSAVVGARLALEPGSGNRAVPVRSAIGGVALALAALVAAGSFTTSLNRLITDTDLQGFAWDIVVFVVPAEAFEPGFDGDPTETTVSALRSDPDIEALTPGGVNNVRIGDLRLIPFVYEPGYEIEPVMLEGRAPSDDDEIVLGTSALRALGRRIGDSVTVVNDVDDGGEITMRIVGRTVVPAVFFEGIEPGFGSAMTLGAVRRLNAGLLSSTAQSEDLLETLPAMVIRYREGVDLRAKLDAIRRRRDLAVAFPFQVRGSAAELSVLERSSGLPVLLTQVLVLMAIATLAHALVASIRKRRGDLAVLKTLGFLKRQVRATVAFQATVIAVIALAIGTPLGLLGGQWGWTWFANTLGLVPEPTTPLLIVLLALPAGTLVLANLIAAVPARAAARTQPAVVLRSE